jgi:hypothetical protein
MHCWCKASRLLRGMRELAVWQEKQERLMRLPGEV